MKIAILGDFHLGYPRFYEDSFKQAELAFSKACDIADVVVLVGDIFDTKIPRLEVIEKAHRIFGKARERHWDVEGPGGKVPIVAIHGTHERRHKDSVNPIQMMDAAGHWTYVHNSKAVFTLGNERISVQGLGGVPEEYAAAAMKAACFKAEEDAFNILVFHQSLKEFIPGGGEMLSIDDLPPGFDIYACGHMHRSHIREACGGKLIIPGSTLLTQMRKEEEKPKGFIVIDTEHRKEEFVEIPSRPFFFRSIQIEGGGVGDVREKAVSEIEQIVSGCKEKPIIRLRITGILGKGLKSSDVVPDLREFSGKAFLEVEMKLDEDDVSRSLELVRGIREDGVSVKRMGLEMLKSKLSEAGCVLDDVDALFDSLADGETEKIVNELLNNT
ncbi:MAG: DNA repair exonuclease [Candidatus Micrarchaeota archaeon]